MTVVAMGENFLGMGGGLEWGHHSHCQIVSGREGTEERNTPTFFLPKL